MEGDECIDGLLMPVLQLNGKKRVDASVTDFEMGLNEKQEECIVKLKKTAHFH